METSNNFFPMDTSGMTPMQTELSGLANADQTAAQAPQQPQGPRPTTFGQSVFTSVGHRSISADIVVFADEVQNGAGPDNTNTRSGEAYAMGFLLPKQQD